LCHPRIGLHRARGNDQPDELLEAEGETVAENEERQADKDPEPIKHADAERVTGKEAGDPGADEAAPEDAGESASPSEDE
jgi:hypothetical protein